MSDITDSDITFTNYFIGVGIVGVIHFAVVIGWHKITGNESNKSKKALAQNSVRHGLWWPIYLKIAGPELYLALLMADGVIRR